MRVCSGTFERNKLYHHVRTGKSFRSTNPTAFMARERSIVDTAYPGDIIWLHDTGTLKIGDSLTYGEELQFIGIPSFAPQIFQKVVNLEPMRSKQLNKGLEQLTEEGVVQLFTKEFTNDKLLGVVGMLQFEVIQHRLKEEYKASVRFEPVEYGGAAWIDAETDKAMQEFLRFHGNHVAVDKDGVKVFLYRNRWAAERAMEENPKVRFYFTSDKRELLRA